MTFGSERLIDELKNLEFEVTKQVSPNGIEFAVIAPYEIELGKFAGRIIELGLQCTPDFPRSVHSSIHVKADPQLYEKSDSMPKVRNITDSSLGTEWRYWSQNFNWTADGTARRLISQINNIFLNA
ncbi:MAG TPA: hypothetical protein VF829_01900 [Candidatus Paceibacterota bacterium]